jgi:hypothetical protein
MSTDRRIIEARVTTICERGCVRVREVIATLQQGRDAPETRGIRDDERMQILHELESIMAVYDAP